MYSKLIKWFRNDSNAWAVTYTAIILITLVYLS